MELCPKFTNLNKKEIYQSQKKTGLLSTIYGVIFSIERNLHSLVLQHENPKDTQTYLKRKYSNIATESIQKRENYPTSQQKQFNPTQQHKHYLKAKAIDEDHW